MAKSITPPRSFKRWTIDAVHAIASIKRIKHSATLDRWLKAETVFTPEDRAYLLHHREILLEKITTWSEEDLKMKFIAHVLATTGIDENERGYRSFFEATLKAPVNGTMLTAVADMVVATGIAEPQIPFFFLQEYKRERGGDSDPLAQVLAAMLMAQSLNESTDALYGCYIIGRNWFFVVLEDKEYAVSDAYVATQDDIFHIVAILRRLKTIVDEAMDKMLAEA